MRTELSRYGPDEVLSVPAIGADDRQLAVELTLAVVRDPRGVATGTVAVMRDGSKRFAEVKALKRTVAEQRALLVDMTATTLLNDAGVTLAIP